MIDQALLNKALSIIDSLPIEVGTITSQDRETDSGDYQIVSFIEWQDQAIMLTYVNDITPERERAFAEFVAHGINLLKYFVGKAFETDQKHDDLLKAFYITFKSLIGEIEELKEMSNGNEVRSSE
jgi:hypothetical protein